MLVNLTLGALGVLLMNAAICFAEDAKYTGASAAWTSDDPVIRKAISLLDTGSFSAAQNLLASDDGHADPSVARAREEMKDLIERLRHEYSLDEAALLSKIGKSIPGVSADDLKKWREAGELQFKSIDGQVRYFRREPSNLLRFSADARQRAHKPQTDPDKATDWKLIDHLKSVVAEAESAGKVEVAPVKHLIEYTISVPANSSQVKKDSLVRMWLPFPQEYRQQKDVKLLSASLNGADYKPQIAPNAIDDGRNTVGGAPQRTAYFETRADDPAKAIEAKISFEFKSFSYYPKLDASLVKPLPDGWNGAYLSARPPHIVFTPQLKDTVAKIINGESNPLLKATKIFHWIDQNIRYHAEEEYCLIRSFSTACLSRHKGDCGIQSTLFITMCRSAGIPARWQSGWESKPVGWTMHDWCEIYIEPWGWLPCDPSYGVQKTEDPRIADFYIGHQDSYRMIVNLDYGRELFPPKQSLRSEPADFQRGEVEVDGKNLYFDDWDYDIKIWVDGKQI